MSSVLFVIILHICIIIFKTTLRKYVKIIENNLKIFYENMVFSILKNKKQKTIFDCQIYFFGFLF